jgi:hypothetical protein
MDNRSSPEQHHISGIIRLCFLEQDRRRKENELDGI